jgi:serine/threonine-protein kinase RsbW
MPAEDMAPRGSPDRSVSGDTGMPPGPARTGHADVAVRLSGGEIAVRRTLVHLRDRLRAAGVAESDNYDVELVLAEVLNNVFEHAYHDRPDGWIELHVRVTPREIEMHLIDEGHAMPNLRLPTGTLPDAAVSLDQLPEGGFGWHLIRSLTDRLSYRRVVVENRLEMTLRRRT